MTEKSSSTVTTECPRKILDVATELFAKRGFDSVSMTEIAIAADCCKGNLYHHFKSKEQLFLSVIRNACASHTHYVEGLIASSMPGFEKIRNLIDFEIRTMFENEARTWLLYRESSDAGHKSVKNISQEIFQQHFSAVVTLFRSLQESGELKSEFNPSTAAICLHGCLDIAFRCRELLDGFPDDLRIADRKSYGEQIFSILMSGMCRSSEMGTPVR